jgi:ATP-binding cassette subfamily B protein
MYLAPKEMLISMTFLTILYVPYKLVTKTINNSGSGLASEWTLSVKILLQGIKNNFFLQAYKLVDEEVELGNKSLNNYFQHQKSYSLSASVLSTLPLFIGVFVISSISYISVTYFGTKSFVLLAFIYIFIRFSQTLSETFNTISQVKFYIPGCKRLMQFHLFLNKDDSHVLSNERQDPIESIELKNLHFGYTPDQLILRNISCDIKKGEILLIKGESGSGKSTLLALILGILKPISGEVHFNNRNVPLDTYQLGYVGPEPYLVPGTIKENLLLGNPFQVDDQSVWNMLDFCQLKDVVQNLEGHLNHYLTETTPLSTGQKQRLSLVRALIRKPNILILDEATANLDEETESVIIKELKKISPQMICLIISHKSSFDPIATNLISLHKNK